MSRKIILIQPSAINLHYLLLTSNLSIVIIPFIKSPRDFIKGEIDYESYAWKIIDSPHGSITVLGIDGKKVTRLQDVYLGPLAEAVAFSPDGKWLFVGSLNDKNVSVLKVEGKKVIDTGKRISLPGSPCSMRGGAH